MATFSYLLSFNKIAYFHPFRRGFFCQNQDLRYPYGEVSVKGGHVALISLLPLIIIVSISLNFCEENERWRGGCIKFIPIICPSSLFRSMLCCLFFCAFFCSPDPKTQVSKPCCRCCVKLFIFLSLFQIKITRSISNKLGTKHYWVKGIQV